MKAHTNCRVVLVVIVCLALSSFAHAQTPEPRWIPTWTASPKQASIALTPGQQAVPPLTFNNQTVRMIVRTTIGGPRVRIQLSNLFGSTPLVVGSAHIGLRSEGPAVATGSDRVLTFSGKRSFTIPAGAVALSDPVDLQAPRQGDLAVSVYIPGEALEVTMHPTALHTTYISGPGDFTTQPAFTNINATTSVSWYWLTSVEVLAPADAAAIVAFGDSITDGATSTVDANRSWPSRLAERILPVNSSIAVLNQGIVGNRILRSSVTGGPNALSRFDRDVLAVPGMKWLMVLEGINDIRQGTLSTLASDNVSSDEVIDGLRQIIERAHVHGVKVIGCTLTPFEGATYYSEKGEAVRSVVNAWIRTGGAFDAVVDFDAAVRDPSNPKRFRSGFNNGDNLHPNDAGYKAMADAIDLSIFGLKPSPTTAAR